MLTIIEIMSEITHVTCGTTSGYNGCGYEYMSDFALPPSSGLGIREGTVGLSNDNTPVLATFDGSTFYFDGSSYPALSGNRRSMPLRMERTFGSYLSDR